MSKYFPVGLKLDDTQTPMEILQDARIDWETESNGLVTLILQTAKSKGDDDMILVHAKHVPSNRTVSLFSLVYRPGNPYPVRIQTKDDELPKFLRKSYYEPGFAGVLGIAAAASVQGRTVTNEWVSETPSEFRNKLSEVFNLGIVKSEVLNLVAGSATAGSKDAAPDEPQEEKE